MSLPIPTSNVLSPETRQLLLSAERGKDADAYWIKCPSCAELLKYAPPSLLTKGPLAQSILQRLLYKHFTEARHVAQG